MKKITFCPPIYLIILHTLSLWSMEKKAVPQIPSFLEVLPSIKQCPSYEEDDEHGIKLSRAAIVYLMDCFPNELQVAMGNNIELDANFLASCNPVHLIQVHAQKPTVSYDPTKQCATLGCKNTKSCSHTKEFRNVLYVQASDPYFSPKARKVWKKLQELTHHIENLSDPDFMIFEGETIKLSGHNKKICEWLMHPQERLQRLNTFRKTQLLYENLLIYHEYQPQNKAPIETPLAEKQRQDIAFLEKYIANLINEKELHVE